MSSLVADVAFDFTFPSCEPCTPPSFNFDNCLLEVPYGFAQSMSIGHAYPDHSYPGHARSSSHSSVYSAISAVSSASTSGPSTVDSSPMTTPPRASPPCRQHGPLLLPKIRSQDQALDNNTPQPKRARTSPVPRTTSSATARVRKNSRPSHTRSFTNPEPITFRQSTTPSAQYGSQTPQQLDESPLASSLLCSPVSFAQDATPPPVNPRRASSCGVGDATIEKYGYPTYRDLPTFTTTAVTGASAPPMEAFTYPNYTHRAPSPLSLSTSVSATPEPMPATTTLLSYLTSANPAPSLVRTISFPTRDPHTKHFWWDVRQVRPWADFDAASVLSLPGAASLLSCPINESLLPTPAAAVRHPETESALHSIYANFYLPKLNTALALSSQRPVQLSIPAKLPQGSSPSELLFVGQAAGDASSAAALFGGKASARVVGIVRSFDAFNTGMRAEGNIKRVEYLRTLAAVHHAMREHGCRYGFILTEIELVLVRNGTESTPHFGFLEVTSVQLASASSSQPSSIADPESPPPMTACLALWALCMLAGDEPLQNNAHWRAEIGAPAEGTRRKILPRETWMPAPQLAEKRCAKRARGWVMPEEPVGRKEIGKRGVRYGAC